jgi:hypothetical protein
MRQANQQNWNVIILSTIEIMDTEDYQREIEDW